MLRFAFGNLLSRRLRSALSVLGLAVAISGMVGLFSIAGGIDRVVSQTFEQIPGLLVQQSGAPIPLFSTLPANWKEDLEQIEGVHVVDPEVFCRVNRLDNEMVLNPPRFAVGMDIPARLKLQRSIYRENLVDGRFFTLDDENAATCLISREIATSHQKEVGSTINLNGTEFVIVGIYDTGSLMLDVNILMDIATCRRLGRIDLNTVGCFYVEAEEGFDTTVLKAAIEDQFRGRDLGDLQTSSLRLNRGENGIASFVRDLHRAIESSPQAKSKEPPSQMAEAAIEQEGSSVEVRTADDWGERIAEFSQDLNIFLVLMTTIGVSIATLSIVNTMMMSVTERTTEFGILRANGWSHRHIIQLVTIESGCIGGFGGLIGAFVGWGATLIINWKWPGRLQLHAGLTLLLFALVFSIALGIVGGLYPAWRASRLSPMESIRRG